MAKKQCHRKYTFIVKNFKWHANSRMTRVDGSKGVTSCVITTDKTLLFFRCPRSKHRSFRECLCSARFTLALRIAPFKRGRTSE